MPTKSGIIGLLAAAQGYRRQDPIEPLLGLKLAVRTDQQGVLEREFQTAHHLVTGKPMPLSDRYYWADAVFTAFVEGTDEMIDGLADALADPAYPIYLGRRSYVPEGRLVLGVSSEPMADVIAATPSQAGRGERGKVQLPTVTLDVQADVGVFPGLEPVRQLQDVPLSFDPERRNYAVRGVVETSVELANPWFNGAVSLEHDPMRLAGELA